MNENLKYTLENKANKLTAKTDHFKVVTYIDSLNEIKKQATVITEVFQLKNNKEYRRIIGYETKVSFKELEFLRLIEIQSKHLYNYVEALYNKQLEAMKERFGWERITANRRNEALLYCQGYYTEFIEISAIQRQAKSDGVRYQKDKEYKPNICNIVAIK